MNTSNITLHEPWLSFLTEMDEGIEEDTVLPCLGGFVVTQCYGFARSTRDFDVLDVAPAQMCTKLLKIAGPASELARKHKVYIDIVGVASVP